MLITTRTYSLQVRTYECLHLLRLNTTPSICRVKSLISVSLFFVFFDLFGRSPTIKYYNVPVRKDRFGVRKYKQNVGAIVNTHMLITFRHFLTESRCVGVRECVGCLGSNMNTHMVIAFPESDTWYEYCSISRRGGGQ